MPEVPQRSIFDSEDDENVSFASSDGLSMSQEQDVAPCVSQEAHLIAQNELQDLIQDYKLLKINAELLRSGLQQWNL